MQDELKAELLAELLQKLKSILPNVQGEIARDTLSLITNETQQMDILTYLLKNTGFNIASVNKKRKLIKDEKTKVQGKQKLRK
jgi:hypothetical protein